MMRDAIDGPPDGASGGRRRITFGLVNNASDRGFGCSEAAFVRLLRRAAWGRALSVRLFAPGCAARERWPVSAAGERYADAAALFEGGLDALLVTGMEPQAAALEEEPAWPLLSRIEGWASARGIPTAWSCLAAHAAVRHRDGIARERLPGKLSGVFACRAADRAHPLMHGLPAWWNTPHSRRFGLSEAALTAQGYDVLSRSDEAGVDVFASLGTAPFLFLQGHPEYAADALLGEFRRDMRRWALNEGHEYPAPPRHYFARPVARELETCRRRALRPGTPREVLLSEVLALLDSVALPVQSPLPALTLFGNWLRLASGDAHGTPALDPAMLPPAPMPHDVALSP